MLIRGSEVLGSIEAEIICLSEEDKQKRKEEEWWALAERVADHMYVEHRDDLGFFLYSAAETMRRVEAMRLVLSSDADFQPMLTKMLSGLCDRFTPVPV